MKQILLNIVICFFIFLVTLIFVAIVMITSMVVVYLIFETIEFIKNNNIFTLWKYFILMVGNI